MRGKLSFLSFSVFISSPSWFDSGCSLLFPAVDTTVPETIFGLLIRSDCCYYCFLSPRQRLMISHPKRMKRVATMLKANVPNTEAEAGSNIFIINLF